jgi:hypothetical protein
VVLIIALAVTGVFWFLYYEYGYVISYGATITPLAIQHSLPIGPFSVGHQIPFVATVTGTNLNSVILTYRASQWVPSSGAFIMGSWASAPMSLLSGGTSLFSYTLPASEVSGSSIQYQISASDSLGNIIRTQMYELAIGDFDWTLTQTSEVVVVRTITSQVALSLGEINGFNDNVTIQIPNSPPAGVSIAPVKAQVTPPKDVVLQITSTSDSQLVQKYSIEVDAMYSPVSLSSIQVIRRTNLILTVTDFELQVAPSYAKIIRPTQFSVTSIASYVVILKTHDGFTVPNGFATTVTGLPSNAGWSLQMVSYTVDASGTTQTTYNLVVSVTSTTTVALYPFDFKMTATIQGTTLSHDITGLQLEVATS